MELFLAMLLAQHVFKIEDLLTDIKNQHEEMLKRNASDMEEARGWHKEGVERWNKSERTTFEWIDEQRSNRITDRLEQHEAWLAHRQQELELLKHLGENGLLSVINVDGGSEGEDEKEKSISLPENGQSVATTKKTRSK
jgi:hypothetical protein